MPTERNDILVDTIHAQDDARVVVVKELHGNLYTGPVDKTELRNRTAVLRRVRTDWINGLLHHSLASVGRIELNLTSDHAFVSWGLAGMVHPFQSDAAVIQPGTHIADVFDAHEQAILILGDPGAGKTTLLLQLAEKLLDRADADTFLPIPIVFNLSGWAIARKPLAQWFVTEMNLRSDIPRDLGSRWIASDNIIPLLDGLDEVDPAHRNDCLEAINQYRSDHGLVPIAVCSRTADYAQLEGKLRLRAAVLVEPLTTADVQSALGAAPELASLSLAAARDHVLADLLRTPLMIWIAAMAYRNTTAAIETEHSPEATRNRLFGAYVTAMFARKLPDPAKQKRTLRSLVQLARTMTTRRLTLFNLEAFTPAFEVRPRRKVPAYILTTLFVLTLYAAACFVLSAAGYGISGLLIGALHHFGYLVTHRVIWSEQWTYTYATAWFISLATSPVCFVITTFTDPRPPETLNFNARNVRGRFLPALATAALLFVTMLLVATYDTHSILEAIHSVRDEVLSRSFLTSVSALHISIVGGVLRLFVGEQPLQRSQPNQGTRRSGVAAVSAAALVLLGGFIFALDNGLIQWVGLAPVLAGLAGGFFVLRHNAVRLYLALTRFGPLRYTTFLDEATRCIFLTRVGGGYVFKHRLLQEYLAERSLP